MAGVGYIEPEALAKLLSSEAESKLVLVVDVREDDFGIGKIPGSLNIPFHSFENSYDILVEATKGKNYVIFHCHFSAQRGPSAAAMARDFYEKAYLPGERPTVLVLRGGFKAWFNLYHNDLRHFQKLP